MWLNLVFSKLTENRESLIRADGGNFNVIFFFGPNPFRNI